MTATKKDEIFAKLADSRSGMLELAATMTAEDWDKLAYSEGSEWRVIDILRHVVDSEKGMTALIVQLKAGGDGVPPDFDLNRWNQRSVTKMQEKSAADLLSDMEVNRANLLTVIDGLDEDDWSRQGRHASLKIMTIEEVCNLIADHERAHTEAIALVVG